MIGNRAAAFARALVLLALVAVGAPWLLAWVARERFDGPAPWSAMPPLDEWRWSTIRSTLTDRLTESTIADVVIRVSLGVAWVAVVIVLATVVAEVAHMIRHGGLPLPDVRGLGASQRLARVIAAGLLVVVPLVGQARTAVALDAAPLQRSVSSDTARPDNVWLDREVATPTAAVDASPSQVDLSSAARPPRVAMPEEASAGAGEYVVRPGDSVYGIAERFAGPDPRAITAFADELLDRNLGRTMPDGQRFTNAAYIDVGWVLELPVLGTATVGGQSVHTVEVGETLWSIAEEHLGEGEAWPEVFEANRGRTFDDGRVLADPDVIQPGWDLVVPDASSTPTSNIPGVDAAPDDPVAERTDGSTAEPDVTFEEERATAAPTPTAPVAAEPAAPDNAWITDGVAVPDQAGVGATSATSGVSDVEPADDPVTDEVAASEVDLLTMRRAAMLSAGVLTLLAVRRRDRLRRARPHHRLPAPEVAAVTTERILRQIDAGDRFARVDLAVRAAAMSLVEQGVRVVAVVIGPDGELVLHGSGPVELGGPWEATGDATIWQLPASTPVEFLAPEARRVGGPCPTLVQLGRDLAERDVYVDLEALEAIEIGGPGDQADAIVAAVAATLASSVLAEVTTLVGVGVPDHAFLGHRLHRPVRDIQRGLEAAAEAIGSTAHAERTTFELRARGTGGETWEPAVVLAGSSVGSVTPPGSRQGLAIVSASPIHGPSSRLAPDGDAWSLQPLGLRIIPIGLSPGELGSIAALTEVPEPVPGPVPSVSGDRSDDPDLTILGPRDDEVGGPAGESTDDTGRGGLDDASPPVAPVSGVFEPRRHALVVRLMGPVVVESADGRAVDFERSKTRELVAWLATHRDRATRSNARAALWELDVRDATFANVASEARRALARCVEPPDGEEWVGRTMTDELPLHDLVVTDVDLLDDALDAARLQPPAQAIDTLRPAVGRIVGLPFEGTSYLWPDAEGITSAIVMRAITATSELAAHCLSLGDIDGVFAASGAGLRVLPAHEDMIAVRMRAYAQIGDRAGVRSEWEIYERAITADPWSDGEPSPRMLELRRELLAGS